MCVVLWCPNVPEQRLCHLSVCLCVRVFVYVMSGVWVKSHRKNTEEPGKGNVAKFIEISLSLF